MQMAGKISHRAAPDCVHAACKHTEHEAGRTGSEPGRGELKKPRELLIGTRGCRHTCIFFAVYPLDVDQRFRLPGKHAEAAREKHQRDVK